MVDPSCPRPAGRVHNTRYAYINGCRCPGARQANLNHSQAWYRTPAGKACAARKRERDREARRYVDQGAVDLACAGRRVRLTRLERYAAIDRLTAANRSAREIGELLGCTSRTVVRRRAAHRQQSTTGHVAEATNSRLREAALSLPRAEAVNSPHSWRSL